MICPNLSNPIIKEEFNKLKKAVGEVRAYDIWNKNIELLLNQKNKL